MIRTMRNLVTYCGVAVFAVAAVLAAPGQTAEKQESGLVITAPPPANAVLGGRFSFPLVASGGAAPYSWRLADGHLPPGLTLHGHSGVISGVPSAAGEYRFTVAVADSSAPPLQTQRAMTITVVAALAIDWKQYPTVQGATLSGSVVVTNQTGQDFDLTVVVVAVNSIGRATTLGYQHFTLAGEQASPVVPFGSSPGLGTYVVRADAIAHQPGKQHVYRARKQTSQPLPINQH
jgi:hypothetical protein